VPSVQAYVVAGNLFHQQPDHRRADALPAVGRSGPDIEQVGIADAVRKQPGHANHPVAVPGDGDVLGSLERCPQRASGPAVVEVVGGQVGLGLSPVDPLERSVDAHRHSRSLCIKRRAGISVEMPAATGGGTPASLEVLLPILRLS
jgi:hypothetical protein